MRRTHIPDSQHIEKADDLDKVVKDKRRGKRATKKKGNRRNRHYEKCLLKYVAKDVEQSQDQ
jgi:hypothetical protein